VKNSIVRASLCAAVFFAVTAGAALADGASALPTAEPLAYPPASFPTPRPSPSASASPGASSAPTAAPETRRARRLTFTAESSSSYTNNQFTGPGTVPSEGPAFIGGSPLAPGVPYDFFNAAPTVSGYGIVSSMVVTPRYALSSQYDVSLSAGYGSVAGNANVASYWGDQPLPTLNVHLGARAYSAPVAFPTSNGADSISADRFSILSGTIGRHDGSLELRAGWFDLAQGESFVFMQAPQTNFAADFTALPMEAIGDGPTMFDALNPLTARLPLQGLDLYAEVGHHTSVELTDAQLPSLPQSPARILSASLKTRSGKVEIGAQIAQLNIAGAAVVSSTSFGGNFYEQPYPSSVSELPVSTLAAQAMTIGGVRADIPLDARTDAQLRLGLSCYGATGASMTAACTQGHYYYGRLQHTFSAFTASLEAIRFEGTYAPAILPYGTQENQWSWSPSWPGQWLKGDYQFVDNSEIGANRQGVRASVRAMLGTVDARFAYADDQQITKYNDTTARTPGFVEGFFLPQTGSGGTLGHEQHASAAFTAHPAIADVELDLTDVTLSRAPQAGVPGDAVALNVPAATLNLSRALGSRFIVNAGVASYAVDGAFETAGVKNSEVTQRVVFAGVQYQLSRYAGYGLQYRLYSVSGIPTLPAPYLDTTTGLLLLPASPAYHGPQFQFEQHFRI
jgi:hypothetical protein